MVLVLFETAAGTALFKLSDEGKLKSVDKITKAFQKNKASDLIKLQAFGKFEDTAEALEVSSELGEGKLPKSIRKFLKKTIQKKGLSDKLAVYDAKLGALIQQKLDIKCIQNETVMELMRGIRANLDELLEGVDKKDRDQMTLGLSHSLSRFKIKFSPDKVDIMIIQAISLLDEVDKELNTYSMRVKEWYGWHFPEMAKIVTDNVAFAQVVLSMGVRKEAKNTDMSDILDEETEEVLKAAAEVSMGTEVSEEDVLNIKSLATQVVAMSEYRGSLFEYLKNRMNAIAPNLTILVGELVGARLIAHAGSLLNLAKHPASTVQILGAEKALFRALKTKHETPKYGLIYHASLVGQAAPKHKGKISRVLAAKCSLSIRVDALGDHEGPTVGFEHRKAVENRLAMAEGNVVVSLSGTAKGLKAQEKFTPNPNASSYNAASDVTMSEVSEPKKSSKKRKAAEVESSDDDESEDEAAKKKAAKKAKKEAKASKKLEKKSAKDGATKKKKDKSDKKSKKKSKKKSSE